MRYSADIPGLEPPAKLWRARWRLRHFVYSVVIALTADFLAFLLIGGGLLFRKEQPAPPISIEVDMRDEVQSERNEPANEPDKSALEPDAQDDVEQRDRIEIEAPGEFGEKGPASEELVGSGDAPPMTVGAPEESEEREPRARREANEPPEGGTDVVPLSEAAVAEDQPQVRLSEPPQGAAPPIEDIGSDLDPLPVLPRQEPRISHGETIRVVAPRFEPRPAAPRREIRTPEFPLAIRPLLLEKRIHFVVHVSPEGKAIVRRWRAEGVPVRIVDHCRGLVEAVEWLPKLDVQGYAVDSEVEFTFVMRW